VEAIDPQVSLLEGLVGALHAMVVEPRTAWDEQLRELVVTVPALLPAWLRVHEQCAQGLQPLLAHRLGLDPGSVAARYVSGAVMMACRIALESWIEPRDGPLRGHLQHHLGLLAEPVLPSSSSALPSGDGGRSVCSG